MWKLTIIFALISRSACEVCNYRESIDITNGVHLKNGVIEYDGFKYQPNEYYIDKTENTTRGCVCLKRTCLSKCCSIGQAFSLNELSCIAWREPFNPTITNEYFEVQDINVSAHFYFIFDKPICVPEKEARALMTAVHKSRNVIRDDGKLYMEVPTNIPPWLVRDPNKYCVDTFIREDENGVRNSSFDALVCFTPDEDTSNYPLSSSCMIISCVFILATVSVYAWLPELRNLHGRVLIAYLLSIFVAFIFLATMQIMLINKSIVPACCLILTFIIYYSLLAAFFWLNVMCFDIWWTFSGKRGMTREKMSIRAKFCAYCVYAFGVPTVLTILLAGLEFSNLPPHPFLPMIRHQGCFLSGKIKLIYLYGPIVILCMANMTFFIMTAMKIAEIKEQTAVLKSRESATHDKTNNERQRLMLYVKLFAVMGVNWILEVVSYFFPKANKVWYITDTYNLLIGLLVFIIFVCKRKIFRLMKKRIKEGILQRKQGMGSISMMHRHNFAHNLKNYKQRDSLDTIRTSCQDSDSNKGTNTTNL